MQIKFTDGPLDGLTREVDSRQLQELGAVIIAHAYEPRVDDVSLANLWPAESREFRQRGKVRYTGRIWQTLEPNGLTLCVEYVAEAEEWE